MPELPSHNPEHRKFILGDRIRLGFQEAVHSTQPALRTVGRVGYNIIRPKLYPSTIENGDFILQFSITLGGGTSALLLGGSWLFNFAASGLPKMDAPAKFIIEAPAFITSHPIETIAAEHLQDGQYPLTHLFSIGESPNLINLFRPLCWLWLTMLEIITQYLKGRG